MSHQSWSTSIPSEKLLSIITVTLNRRETLRRCISSLSNLTYDYSEQCEHLIIDGSKSIGATVDLEASGYSDISCGNPITSRRFLKEADSGLYHAMDKGVSASLGRYIWFLNDDDYLYSLNGGALIKLLAESKPAVVVGTIIYREIIYGNRMDRKFYPQSVSYEELIADGSLRRLPHPATIVKKTDWPDFDHLYTMIADYVALAAVLKRCGRTTAFPDLKVVMVRGEETLSKINRHQRDVEAETFNQGLFQYRRKSLRYRIRLGLWAIRNWKAILKKELGICVGRLRKHNN